MSQENVEIVRETVRAWNDRDLDRMLELSSGEVEWAPSNPGAVDSVLWLGFVHAQGRASGVELSQEFSHHISLRDGKVVSTQSYLSWQQGLEAAGVSEKS